MEMATFGAGCFWGIEAAFKKIRGVLATTVGYSGGHVAHPTYEQVCTGRTGHAEVVQVEFDPEQVSYEELLDAFWKIHDPTSLNKQGFDVGTQYRSVIFTHSKEQEKIAKQSKESLRSAKWVVTEILPAGPFYEAEDYHQNYYEKRGGGSCPRP